MHRDSCVNQPILNSPGHMGVCQKPNFQAILAKCQTITLWWLWQQMGRLEKKTFNSESCQHREKPRWLFRVPLNGSLDLTANRNQLLHHSCDSGMQTKKCAKSWKVNRAD